MCLMTMPGLHTRRGREEHVSNIHSLACDWAALRLSFLLSMGRTRTLRTVWYDTTNVSPGKEGGRSATKEVQYSFDGGLLYMVNATS